MGEFRVFIGYDPRQPVAYNLLQHSIARRASRPVQITPLILRQLPIRRTGLTEFTFSRYLPPYLMGYEGWGLFLDPDMLCLSDIYSLYDLRDDAVSVQVVKNKQKFEWPSLMLFNCALCGDLTLEHIENGNPNKFGWGEVGELPAEWNHCVGYDKPKESKLVHFTQGIPIWREVRGVGYEEEWFEEYQQLKHTVSWLELMGNSVHAPAVLSRIERRVKAGRSGLEVA